VTVARWLRGGAARPKRREDVVGPLVAKQGFEGDGDAVAVGGRGGGAFADEAGAVEVGDAGGDLHEAIVAHGGEDAERDLATAVETAHDGAFGEGGDTRGLVVERREQLLRVVIGGAALERERPLAGGGNEDRLREELVSGGGFAEQPAESGGGDDDAGELRAGAVEFLDAGVEVALQVLEVEVLENGAQDGLAPEARRADDGVEAELFDRRGGAADVRIGGLLALEERGELEAIGQFGGDVLEAVDGEVDLAGEERALDLLDEEPLAGGAEGGRGLYAVAGGADGDGDELEAGLERLEFRDDETGLREGERAATSADPDR
jgi:hypothetical protein